MEKAAFTFSPALKAAIDQAVGHTDFSGEWCDDGFAITTCKTGRKVEDWSWAGWKITLDAAGAPQIVATKGAQRYRIAFEKLAHSVVRAGQEAVAFELGANAAGTENPFDYNFAFCENSAWEAGRKAAAAG